MQFCAVILHGICSSNSKFKSFLFPLCKLGAACKIARLFRNHVYESEQKNSGKRIMKGRQLARSANLDGAINVVQIETIDISIGSFIDRLSFSFSANLINAYTSDRVNVLTFSSHLSCEVKYISRWRSLRENVREWLAQLTRPRDSQWWCKFPANWDLWCVSQELSSVRTATSSRVDRSWVEIPRRRQCRPFSSSLLASRYPE